MMSREAVAKCLSDGRVLVARERGLKIATGVSKNKKLKNYFKLLDYFGIDIDSEIRNRVQDLVGKNDVPKKDQGAEDVFALIHGLDSSHRKELLSTAVNLHKLKKNTKLNDVISRIEKQFIQGG